MRKKPGPDVLKAKSGAAAATENRKPWRKPKLEVLSIRQTQGGFITNTFEGPLDIFFGS